jgi:hypothetical protein
MRASDSDKAPTADGSGPTMHGCTEKGRDRPGNNIYGEKSD